MDFKLSFNTLVFLAGLVATALFVFGMLLPPDKKKRRSGNE